MLEQSARYNNSDRKIKTTKGSKATKIRKQKHTILKQIIYANISLILHPSLSESKANTSSGKKKFSLWPTFRNFPNIDNAIQDIRGLTPLGRAGSFTGIFI